MRQSFPYKFAIVYSNYFVNGVEILISWQFSFRQSKWEEKKIFKEDFYIFRFSTIREQQIKSEPCSELELIAIRACAATLCCGTIKDEWFQKTVAPWLDQFMAAHEVNNWFDR